MIKPDIGKGVAVPAKGILKNRIKRDLRVIAFENIASVQNSRNFKTHVTTANTTTRGRQTKCFTSERLSLAFFSVSHERIGQF